MIVSSLNSNFQDTDSLGKYIGQFSKNQFLELASNFHFLLFLKTNNIVHFTEVIS